MLRAAVIGATGYTGAELCRLLLGHPDASLVGLYGNTSAGKPVAAALPSLTGLVPGDVRAFDARAVAGEADVAFCALPHGASAACVAALREAGLVVLDLSADFRLRARVIYEHWYGPHPHPERLGEAVYGLVELHREELRGADLIAVPGCYPTASILPLAPLFAERFVAVEREVPIIIDAKSGVSGAGRGGKERTSFSETSEGFRAYAVAGRHRHTPEIEQELARVAGFEVRTIFSPHLVPMIRGILVTTYVPTSRDLPASRLVDCARAYYEGSPSVEVLDPDAYPDTAWVRGSNRAMVSYTIDARSGFVVAQCAIDNLVKGAAGQAIQAMNVRFGFDEGAGIRHPATWP